jgi:hypothetical protein
MSIGFVEIRRRQAVRRGVRTQGAHELELGRAQAKGAKGLRHGALEEPGSRCTAMTTGESRWGSLFASLADKVAGAPPRHPTPLSQDGLLGLFSAEVTGANFRLEPATEADMRGVNWTPAASLEVVYDDA